VVGEKLFFNGKNKQVGKRANDFLRVIAKGELTTLKLEHILIFVLGVGIITFGQQAYESISQVPKVIVLIIFLGSLVGIAHVGIPVFKTIFWQVVFAGLVSAVLDSFIVLLQMVHLRTVEVGQMRDEIMSLTGVQPVEGERAKLLTLMTISAIVGGLNLWFGEAYAAGVFINDGRTSILSALYIVPPVLLFLGILGLYAQKTIHLEVVPNHSVHSSKRDVIEFAVGIGSLLLFHNPLLCLGGLLIYAVVTRQDDHLIEVWKFHTEVNVMLVLIIAWVGGAWLVSQIIEPLSLNEGIWKPIIPAAIQSVLWGPLYEDPSVNFWIKIATISTGALLLPISSLVGVMLFRTPKQWLAYCKYSFATAILWYAILIGWIYLTYSTPTGHFLEQWAHTGGVH